MVAPSFQSMKRISDVYFKNGKHYIDVQNEKTGTVRAVRWYSESEYSKNYGKTLSAEENKGFDGLKQARGFNNGPIMVLRGNTSLADEEWCAHSIARYAMGLGWHFISTDTIPSDIPSHFKGIVISWEEFKDGDDRHMKTPAALDSLISTKLKANKEVIHFNYFSKE